MTDKFEILSEIGRGAAGVVYRARSRNLDRVVAVKKFHADWDRDTLQRARREAQCLSKIEHPNLVRVYSIETDDTNEISLVVDLVDGKTLSELLTGGPLSVTDANSLFGQLCDGLTAMHEAGVIHRDIKPGNIMVVENADGGKHLKIIDFGLAKSFTDTTSQKLTKTGLIMGTPAYMSPEQFAGRETTPASDVYAAGCVLFQMLTGRLPFPYDSPYAVAHAQQTEEPQDIAMLAPHLKHAASINLVIQRALALDPLLRFASAADLKQAYLSASEHGSAPAIKPRLHPRKHRKFKLVMLGAVSLATAIIGGVLVLPHLKLPEAPQRRFDSGRKMIDTAKELIKAREYQQAKELLTNSIPQTMNMSIADMAEAYDVLAGLHLQLGEADEARKAATTAVDFELMRPIGNKERLARCYYITGRAKAKLQDFNGAWSQYQNYLKLRSGASEMDDDHFYAIALTRLHLGQAEEVLPGLTKRVVDHATQVRFTRLDEPSFSRKEQQLNEIYAIALRMEGELEEALAVTATILAKGKPSAAVDLERAAELALAGKEKESEKLLADSLFKTELAKKQTIVDNIHLLNHEPQNDTARKVLRSFVD